MSEYIWETFDDLFKTVHRQGRKVEELEARVAQLEEQLQKRTEAVASRSSLNELPAEKAA